MSKLSAQYENPIDAFLLRGVELISEPLHCMGVTPNMVTTASLIAGMGAAYTLKERKYELSAILTVLAYFLDCADGYMARKYKQTSNFGDWYDHVSDFVKLLSLLFVMYKLDKRKFYQVVPVMIVTGLLSFIHLGCQEKVYGQNESSTLAVTTKLCPGDPNKSIRYTKYIGCGTLTLVIVLSTLYFKK